MKIVLIVIGLLLIVATLLSLLRKEAWWVRMFDFPRLQVTILSAITLVLYLVLLLFQGTAPNLLEMLFLAALTGALLYQTSMMYPYTALSRKQVHTSPSPGSDATLTVLFANVKMDNRQAEELRAIIREVDPDVILAAETDEWWASQLEPFEASHPHVVRHPQDNFYGMMLYSRLELIDPEVKFLVEADIPSIHGQVKLPSGQTVELYCLHPRPPAPAEREQSTERDAELLIVAREIKSKNVPAVVFGDLNDVAWSHTNYLFQQISGLLDPRIGRGFFNSFHAKYPVIRFPLDHFFHTNHFRLIQLTRLRPFGSDHFPMFIALAYEPDAQYQQAEEEVGQEEQQEADDKLERAP